jgi:hypothetical protein
VFPCYLMLRVVSMYIGEGGGAQKGAVRMRISFAGRHVVWLIEGGGGREGPHFILMLSV